ncbi:MAG: hypothetical protein LBH79_00255 [Nitrososphaerota archaeon]|jgi:hypothetical protein|nr:hypothetical protein [Nitrososphaerota archaeon]
MNNTTLRIVCIMIIAIILVVIITGVINQNSPKENNSMNLIPQPYPNATSIITEIGSTPLTISLSRIVNSSETIEDLNITKGETITINVDLSLGSNQKERTIPLYLSVGAFESEPVSKMITSPPKPYPVLPWPNHDDSPTMAKPFEATFNPDGLTIKPNQSKSTTLTISALDEAQLGTYTLFVEFGELKQTGTGGTKFDLTVLPKI